MKKDHLQVHAYTERWKAIASGQKTPCQCSSQKKKAWVSQVNVTREESFLVQVNQSIEI